jgi:4-hydroxybenzoate polyprenyltransferase
MGDPTGWRRWWVYQRERFPLVAHGPLILAFSFCAVAFSAHLRGGSIDPGAVMVAAVTSLVFFLQLRIADEFKDAEDDARWRPYRPVPRGLVRLRELAWVFALGALLQAGLALLWHPAQLVVLAIAWAYLAAMSCEFGCRAWLKRRPVVYLLSHMLIMPLVDLYATACDWSPAQGHPPAGLLPFLAASFANGLVIELGRKIRSPADEEPGVETYSALWGPHRATVAWGGLVILTAALATVAAGLGGAALPVALILGPGALAAVLLGRWFLGRQQPGDGKRIELAAGLWTLLLYATLGFLPSWWTTLHG